MEVASKRRINGAICVLQESMTTEELSSQLGMCSRTLAYRKKDPNTWSFEEILKLSEITGCPINEFVEEVPDGADEDVAHV